MHIDPTGVYYRQKAVIVFSRTKTKKYNIYFRFYCSNYGFCMYVHLPIS